MDNFDRTVLDFIQALDTCFTDDEGFIETCNFTAIREALLGIDPTDNEHHHNLDVLATSSEQLRWAIVYRFNDQIRHGNKSISVDHKTTPCSSSISLSF